MHPTLINYVIGFALCVTATYFAITLLGAYAVVVVPLWGALLAKPLLEVIILMVKHFKNAPFKPYQGIYYAFNNRQVRVFEVNGALWVADEDVLPLIGLKASDSARRQSNPKYYQSIRGAEKETVWIYAEIAILEIVGNSLHKDSIKFRRWLEREVYLPYRNKA